MMANGRDPSVTYLLERYSITATEAEALLRVARDMALATQLDALSLAEWFLSIRDAPPFHCDLGGDVNDPNADKD